METSLESASRARKRSKVTRACDTCKARKKACTGEMPCKFCFCSALPCTYNVPYHRGIAAAPLPATDGGKISRKTPRGRSVSTPTNSSQNPNSENGDHYRGPASAHSFLERAVRNLYCSRRVVDTASEDAHVSIFSRGDRPAAQISVSQIQWPTRPDVDYLVRQYFDFVAPTYRLLHRGTVEGWVNLLFGQQHTMEGSGPATGLSSAAQAVILTMCATASLFFNVHNGPAQNASTNASDGQQGETYYQMAEQLLAQEHGAPSLESVQARLLTVLYLLNTSRMNRAWFNFGPTVQLLTALGMHRKQLRPRPVPSVASAQVTLECTKRVFWCCFILDQYLSLVIGRPRLLHEEDVDQEYPRLINDENLDAKPSRHIPARDCLMDAPVCHAKIARILAQGFRQLYSIRRVEKEQETMIIGNLMDQISQWQSELPPLLGDSVCPSSLVSTFQRQLTVIRLARYHAVMFVTRPLLLRDYCEGTTEPEPPLRQYLRSCITTARDTLDFVLELVKENLFFPSFWYTQYIAFNALAIVYVCLIHTKWGRIPRAWLFADADSAEPAVNQSSLYKLAEETQYHLGQATETNAVAWRYNIMLEALREEATGQTSAALAHEDGDRSALRTSIDGNNMLSLPDESRGESIFESFLAAEQPIMNWETFQDPSAFDSALGNFFTPSALPEDLGFGFWPQT